MDPTTIGLITICLTFTGGLFACFRHFNSGAIKLETRLTKLETSSEPKLLKQQVAHLETRTSTVETRLDKIDDKLSSVEKSLIRMEGYLEIIKERTAPKLQD